MDLLEHQGIETKIRQRQISRVIWAPAIMVGSGVAAWTKGED